MSSFEQALEALAMQISEMTGRPYQRGMAVTERTAPTPAATPGPPMGGPELRATQPTVGDDVASLVRNYIGGTLGDRVAPVAGTVLDYGPMPAQIATDIAAQPVRAGQAVADAAMDPSLGKIGNAGAQTAMALAQPVKAAGIAAGTLGLAAADDLGLNPISEATATDPASEIPGLTPEQAQEYRTSQDIIAKGRFKTGAERRYHEGVLARYNRIQEEFAVTQNKNSAEERARKAAADQAEYDRAVGNAERARDEALARDVRFADTTTGQAFNDMGGILPIAAAFGGGALSRMGFGGGGKELSIAKDYIGPMVSGAGASFGTMNIPLFADMNAPSVNPEKEAYQAYSRELPPTHPRKEEFATYASNLPERNPVQEQAYQQFYEGLPKRLGVAALEGATFGKLGSAAVNSIPRMVREHRTNSAPPPPPTTPPPAGPSPAGPPPIPGAPKGGGGRGRPPQKPQGSGGQGPKGQGPQSVASGGHPSQFQKRGKNGQFKKGFTFKPRGAPAANQPQAPNTIAGIGQSAIKNPNPQGIP